MQAPARGHGQGQQLSFPQGTQWRSRRVTQDGALEHLARALRVRGTCARAECSFLVCGLPDRARDVAALMGSPDQQVIRDCLTPHPEGLSRTAGPTDLRD